MKDLFTRHERLTRASAARIGQLRMNYNKPLELLLNPGNGPYRAGADSSRYQGNDMPLADQGACGNIRSIEQRQADCAASIES
jgi:hypothetical protein